MITEQIQIRLLWISGSVLFLLILIRCFLVPPYVDEVVNLHYYVRTADFIPFLSPADANNHLISTFFNYLSFQIFGATIIPMRIIEASGFLVLFYFLMKMRKQFNSEFVSACFVLTICTSFFILSYFSLARGYGLSIAFLIGSIYYLIKIYNESCTAQEHLKAGILISLSVWCNLSLLITACFVLMLIALHLLTDKKQDRRKKFNPFLSLTLTGFLPVTIAVLYSFNLKNSGAFWAGGKTGFFHDIVLDLTHETFGVKGVWLATFISLVLIVTLLINRLNLNISKPAKISTLLLCGAILGTILLHVILDINYPQNRAAIHIVVLCIACWYFWMDSVQSRWRYISFFPALIMFIHFCLHFNFNRTHTWQKYDVSFSMFEAVWEKQKQTDQLFTLSGPYFVGSVFDFYTFKTGIALNSIQWTHHPDDIADIVFKTVEDEISNPRDFDTIWYDPVSEICALERIEKIKWKAMESFNLPNQEIIQEEQTLFESPVYFDSTNNLKLEFEMQLTSQNDILYDHLVIQLFDSSETEIGRELIDLSHLSENYKNSVFIRKAIYFKLNSPGQFRLMIGLTNHTTKGITMSNFSVKLFKQIHE